MNCYACLVSLGERPEPFGDESVIFSRKKDAKQYAAKLAIEWLIENNHMPSNGSVSFPKPRRQQSVPKAASTLLLIPIEDGGSTGGTSYGQRVAEMCAKLAMAPPTYVISPLEDFPAIYSGHATFGNSPEVMGPVGHFSNVYGRKKAKETCAEKVLQFLEGIAADRAGIGTVAAQKEKEPDRESISSLLD